MCITHSTPRVPSASNNEYKFSVIVITSIYQLPFQMESHKKCHKNFATKPPTAKVKYDFAFFLSPRDGGGGGSGSGNGDSNSLLLLLVTVHIKITLPKEQL